MKGHKATVPTINLCFNHARCQCVHSSTHCLHRVTFPFLLIQALLHWSVALKRAWTVVWRCRLHFCYRPDRRRSNQAGGRSCGGPPGRRGGSRPGLLGLHEEIQVRNWPPNFDFVTFIFAEMAAQVHLLIFVLIYFLFLTKLHFIIHMGTGVVHL